MLTIKQTAAPICSRSALESKNKTKEVKQTHRRGKRSHVEKLAKSAEEAAFVGDMGEVYKITKKLVNINTKVDPPYYNNILIILDTPVVDLNGNILSTDKKKLNRWGEVPLLLQPQKLFHQLEAYHKLLPVNRK